MRVSSSEPSGGSSSSQFPPVLVYFPGLNGVRFLAATVVLIVHIEQFKNELRTSEFYTTSWIHSMGNQAVCLFFVLSGFLITSLLLRELEVKGRIDVVNYLLRRALRILPVYYLMVGIAFALLPLLAHDEGLTGLLVQAHYAQIQHVLIWDLALFLALFPNLALILFGPTLFISQFWTIGVELQFYLLWPLIIRAAPRLLLPWLLLSIAFIKVGFEEWLLAVSPAGVVSAFVHQFQLESLAIGAAGASLLSRPMPLALSFLRRRWARLGAVPLILVVLPLADKHYLLSASCYALALMVMVNSPYGFVNLETKTFRYLGNLSYGIYMGQVMAIIVALSTLEKVLGLSQIITRTVLAETLIYALSMLFTLGLAMVFYHGVERRFLPKKRRFGSLSTSEGRP